VEEPVKYVILIYGNPASRELWSQFSRAERVEGLRVYAALNEELTASGELVVTQALGDPAHGRRISVLQGRTMTSDGPFAEAKEHLAGFYLVDCVSMDRAIEIAGRIPEAGLGLVEVRPAAELDDLAM
jgi:hypothetical protein